MTHIRQPATETDDLGAQTDSKRGTRSPLRVLTHSHCSPSAIEPLLASTVGSTLEAAAERWPDTIALVAESASRSGLCRWTFADLEKTARAVAWSLLARFHPGDRIAVWAPNVAEHFLVDLGAALADLRQQRRECRQRRLPAEQHGHTLEHGVAQCHASLVPAVCSSSRTTVE